MKAIVKVLSVAIVGIFLVAGSALAIPTDGSGTPIVNTPGYSWIDEAYWTPTDFTTASDGSAFFVLEIEIASYESDFGLFIVDDYTNPTSIVDTQEVFNAAQSPVSSQSVYFKDNGGTWQVSIDDNNYKNFDNVFGFYYGVHTGGSGSALDYTYYSDWSFNTEDVGDQHVAVEWDGIENIKIYLEDLRTANADWDWKDMTVIGNDIAPVPEPTTILLSGLGLLGMGAYLRRRRSKKA